jgi:hypothetical protein
MLILKKEIYPDNNDSESETWNYNSYNGNRMLIFKEEI